MKTQFQITGMSCAACEAHVRKAVLSVRGVTAVQISLLQNRMTVEHLSSVTVSDIMRAVEQAGYGARKVDEKQQYPQDESYRLKNRFLYSCIFLLPLLYVTMGKLFFPFYPAFLEEKFICQLFFQLLFTLPVLWINRSFFINGFYQLFRLSPTMDSLVAVGAGASFLFSIGQCILGLFTSSYPHLYFESAAMIVTLITLGKWLEARAKEKTSRAISALIQLMPSTAVIKQNGEEKTVEVSALKKGDLLVVRAGERLAADGIIQTGRCSIDESVLTGESLPQEKKEGDLVRAGTLLASGYVEVFIRQTGADTLLAQITCLVEEASSGKAPVSQLADRISAIFVPSVMLVSLLTFIGWLLAGKEIGFAVSCAVSVLVISCPCALGLATPTAIMVGMEVAAKRGILIKSASVLENECRVTTVVLDKTGTVTVGKMKVSTVIPADGFSVRDVLQWAGAVEKPSEHAFAKAVCQACEDEKISLSSVTDFVFMEGLGVQGKAGSTLICGGNAEAMRKWNINLPSVSSLPGKIPLFFAKDGEYIGTVFFSDTLRPSAKEAVLYLQKLGKKILLLTGDRLQTAREIAEQLSIKEVRAEVLPQEKEQVIAHLQANREHVAMAGDGVNDAPALARAEVGISFHTGTDVAAETADIVLMRDDLRDIGVAFELSAAVLKNIKENLFWAFFYNVIGIPLAAGLFYVPFGWKLNPVFAAAAMSVSSLCVVTNALRLRFFKPCYQSREEKVMRKTLVIQGMMCGHCAAHVARALNSIEGVRAEVNLDKKTAVVESAQEIPDEVLIQAVQNAGYEVVSIH